MNYQRIYDQLIERGQNRIPDGFTENHHILPECQGGTRDKSNMVRLTPEEHYVAHQLLVKMNPKNYSLIKAAVAMCRDSHGHRINNKMYGWLKKKHAKAQGIRSKGQTKENCESVARMAKTISGRTAETHLYIADQVKSMTGRRKETHEGPRKTSEALSNRTKETHQYLQNSSDKHTGRRAVDYEYIRLNALNTSNHLKGRTKETHSYIASTAEILTGRSQYTHEAVSITAEKLRKFPLDQYAKLVEMKDSGVCNKDILEYFNSRGFHLGRSSISRICKIYKKDKILIEAKINLDSDK